MTDFICTRGGPERSSFVDAILDSVTERGGLFVPEYIPRFSEYEIARMKMEKLPFSVFRVLQAFGLTKDIPGRDLLHLCIEAYHPFSKKIDNSILPLREFESHKYILELIQGPTQAFKDYALAVFGKIVGYLLEKRGLQGVVIAATSGDTGPAGMTNVASENIIVNTLYPYGGTSGGQERQMTAFSGKFAQAYALRGCDFDDTQAITKFILGDTRFRETLACQNKVLISINSINWLRIAVQVGYMFSVSCNPKLRGSFLNFAIPSGNFGNSLSGYIAYLMGAPIGRIMMTTNENDILFRLATTGEHFPRDKAIQTCSPAMDITQPSNFERLMYYQHGSEAVENWYGNDKGHFKISGRYPLGSFFEAACVPENSVKDTILLFYRKYKILLDPHSATAANIAFLYACDSNDMPHDVVAFATAHPCKFDETIKAALGDLYSPEMIFKGVSQRFLTPYQMSQEELDSRRVVINDASPEVIKALILAK